jgi:ribosome-associated translation inhibitor RaiA
MDLDIETEHVHLRPEWRSAIDEWVSRCARCHPDVRHIEVTLRHADRQAAAEVDAVAIARGRTLRAVTHAPLMGTALEEALAAVEGELAADEKRPVDKLPTSRQPHAGLVPRARSV